MSGTTPNQGFPYPVASDPPCNWPTTMLALASALDTKFQGFDTDTARLAKRKYVKVSRSGSPTFSYDSNQGGDMLFDTVETNNGTPTDLTVDPYRVQLAAGFYLLYAKLIIPTQSSGGDFQARLSGSSAQLMSTSNITARDFGGTYTPICITWHDQMYVPSGTGKVSLSVIPPGASVFNINYASVAAWWFADA